MYTGIHPLLCTRSGYIIIYFLENELASEMKAGFMPSSKTEEWEGKVHNQSILKYEI